MTSNPKKSQTEPYNFTFFTFNSPLKSNQSISSLSYRYHPLGKLYLQDSPIILHVNLKTPRHESAMDMPKKKSHTSSLLAFFFSEILYNIMVKKIIHKPFHISPNSPYHRCIPI